jgi:hypothetical protein
MNNLKDKFIFLLGKQFDSRYLQVEYIGTKRTLYLVTSIRIIFLTSIFIGLYFYNEEKFEISYNNEITRTLSQQFNNDKTLFSLCDGLIYPVKVIFKTNQLIQEIQMRSDTWNSGSYCKVEGATDGSYCNWTRFLLNSLNEWSNKVYACKLQWDNFSRNLQLNCNGEIITLFQILDTSGLNFGVYIDQIIISFKTSDYSSICLSKEKKNHDVVLLLTECWTAFGAFMLLEKFILIKLYDHIVSYSSPGSIIPGDV